MDIIRHSLNIKGRIIQWDKSHIGTRVLFTPTKYLDSDFPRRQEIGVIKDVDTRRDKGVLVVYQNGTQWTNPKNIQYDTDKYDIQCEKDSHVYDDYDTERAVRIPQWQSEVEE